jgi:hypothetical protein
VPFQWLPTALTNKNENLLSKFSVAMAPLTPTHSQCSLDSFFDPFMDDDAELFFVPLQTKRKRVRINPDWILLDYVQHVSELTPEDRVRGWWSKDEYEATKLAAKTNCRELRRKGAFKGCLTDAYEQACNVADKATPGHDDLSSCETRDQLVPRSVSSYPEVYASCWLSLNCLR